MNVTFFKVQMQYCIQDRNFNFKIEFSQEERWSLFSRPHKKKYMIALLITSS